MKYYDKSIQSLKECLKNAKRLDNTKKYLSVSCENSVLFKSDTAFELGGSQKPCVSALAVSNDITFSNAVYLLGEDLPQIKSDTAFTKFVLIQLEKCEEDQSLFNQIKELEALKYHTSIEGFMCRASAMNMREQIRVSKKVIQKKIGFKEYGYTFLQEFLKRKEVISAEIYFVTATSDFDELQKIAKMVVNTTSALNHIYDNVMYDCSSCNLKVICDEVEGLKELHSKNVRK